MSSARQLYITADAGLVYFSLLVRGEDNNILRYVDHANYPWKDDMTLANKTIERKVARIVTPFTLMPASEFNSTMIHRVAQQAFPLESVDHVHHFIHEGIAVVYIISSEFKSQLLQQFPDYRIEHVLESFIKHRLSHDPSVLAHWTEDGVLLMANHNGLRLANYYKITAPEDAIYYILSAYQYADLDPLSQALNMSGRISKDGLLFNKLSGFVRDFEWLNQSIDLPEEFPFDAHVFYHLTN